MKLNISKPVIISMGPDSRKAGWGPYQFPDLIVLEDGRLFCAFNDRPDSEVDYVRLRQTRFLHPRLLRSLLP